MAKIKFTKSALREEEKKLQQLEGYLPTLKMKKKLLQFEILKATEQIDVLNNEREKKLQEIDEFSHLLTGKTVDVLKYAFVRHVYKRYENIAGIEIAKFEGVQFDKEEYMFFDTPPWMEGALFYIKKAVELHQNVLVEEEKKQKLLKELKEVSIRVNLFEKILIPKTCFNIKKIKIFLEDRDLEAFARAKVAKKKNKSKSI